MTCPDCRSLKIAAKPPHGFKEFRIDRVPQPAPVEVNTQLPDSGHELASPHLRGDLR